MTILNYNLFNDHERHIWVLEIELPWGWLFWGKYKSRLDALHQLVELKVH